MEEIRKNARRLEESLIKAPITIPMKKIINKKTPVMAMGSCFAVEIRNFLIHHGYNAFGGFKKKEVNLVWYNTYSIRYEFERLIGKYKQDVDDIWELEGVVKNPAGKFQDPYRKRVFENTKNALWEKIKIIDSYMRQCLSKCRVLIITLGLVEVWMNPPTNKITCTEPGYPHGFGGGNNCKFKFTTYDENLNNMITCMEIINKFNPDCQVIITTSPVGLAKTFREVDICIANMESKSILRSVCGELERRYENVIYYPSYEIAMLSERKSVYQDDGRHIKPIFISKVIMRHFYNHFLIGDK